MGPAGALRAVRMHPGTRHVQALQTAGQALLADPPGVCAHAIRVRAHCQHGRIQGWLPGACDAPVRGVHQLGPPTGSGSQGLAGSCLCGGVQLRRGGQEPTARKGRRRTRYIVWSGCRRG